MIYLASILLFTQVSQLLTLLYAQWKLQTLPSLPLSLAILWPKVSIIIPARDEESEIEQALQSVLRMDYPEHEVIIVNDRSCDRTASILEGVQTQHPELRVVTIEQLPDGWLGKNNALQMGAEASTGDLLLFTDADVNFSRAALRKAVAVLEIEQLDHLALGPKVHSPSLMVNLLIAFFSRSFYLFVKPWRVRDQRSPNFIGIGAFNLVRRSAYEQIGGHRRISLRPDDDMKLGKLIKQAGFRQDFRSAPDDLQVAWYSSVAGFVRGLEKNVLAGMDYRSGVLFLSLTLALALGLLPWFLLIVGDSLIRTLCLATVAVSMTGFGLFFRVSKAPLPFVVLEPFILLLFVYTCARSAVLALLRQGIYWRGTFYPLDLLRRNVV